MYSHICDVFLTFDRLKYIFRPRIRRYTILYLFEFTNRRKSFGVFVRISKDTRLYLALIFLYVGKLSETDYKFVFLLVNYYHLKISFLEIFLYFAPNGKLMKIIKFVVN